MSAEKFDHELIIRKGWFKTKEHYEFLHFKWSNKSQIAWNIGIFIRVFNNFL